jgi:hypothetical protein
MSFGKGLRREQTVVPYGAGGGDSPTLYIGGENKKPRRHAHQKVTADSASTLCGEVKQTSGVMS